MSPLGTSTYILTYLIAAVCSVEALYALALEAEYSTCFSTLTDSVLDVAVDSGNSYLRTENSLGISNRDIAVDIIALAPEDRVRLNADNDEEIDRSGRCLRRSHPDR